MRGLEGRVALVAGATRGAGRGISVELGAAGATVYCTGRSSRGQTTGRPGCVEETAELVTRAGGIGIALRVDHSQPDQVKELARRIEFEQGGRLDFVVNDIWGGDDLIRWGVPYWEHSLEDGLRVLSQAIYTHIITSHFVTPLLVKRKAGTIFEITDGDTYDYRQAFYYDLVKVGVMRIASNMASDLAPYGVTAVAVTPGFLRSESMLDRFGVTEATWRDGIVKDPFFAFSETPRYIGRAVAALASDRNIHRKTGQTLSTWDLSEEYGFVDADGSKPNWKRNSEALFAARRSASQSDGSGTT
jgi:NAD(P)-dependent dehydrogenase (short-subunit alcohol dehydrogenase family)